MKELFLSLGCALAVPGIPCGFLNCFSFFGKKVYAILDSLPIFIEQSFELKLCNKCHHPPFLWATHFGKRDD